MKKSILAGLAVALAVILGVTMYGGGDPPATNTGESNQTAQQTEQPALVTLSDDGSMVTYQGEAGVTALDTLKSITEVATEESSFGEFVAGINGVEADSSKEFWAFYVNGELANEGAGTYVAEAGDTFEWRIEAFE